MDAAEQKRGCILIRECTLNRSNTVCTITHQGFLSKQPAYLQSLLTPKKPLEQARLSWGFCGFSSDRSVLIIMAVLLFWMYGPKIDMGHSISLELKIH